MKRAVLLLTLLCVALTSMAQSSDSVQLVNAKRETYKLGKGAKGYQLTVKIFGDRRVISVIKFSPKRTKSIIAFNREGGLTTQRAGQEHMARFGINGGFPYSYERVDGVDLDRMLKWSTEMLDYVDGLLLIYRDHYDIVGTKEAPHYDKYAAECDNIMATGPVLIEDGEIRNFDAIMSSKSSTTRRIRNLYTKQHPRSVVGIDKRGFVYFIVVDGRHGHKATGLSMDRLALVCRWLGMHEAINLDGGGSSTLWTRRFGVLNHPCDNRKFDHKGLRSVRNHIVVK